MHAPVMVAPAPCTSLPRAVCSSDATAFHPVQVICNALDVAGQRPWVTPGDTRYSLSTTGPIIPTAQSTTTTTPLRRYVRPALETLLGPRNIAVAPCRCAGRCGRLYCRPGRVPAQRRVVAQSSRLRRQPHDLGRCRPEHRRTRPDDRAAVDRHQPERGGQMRRG